MRPLLVFALLCMAHGAARAEVPLPLLLEVWIGDQTDGQAAKLVQENGHLFMSEADFAALNLSLAVVPKDGRVDLLHVPGIVAHIDQVAQRLELTVATAALPRQDFDLRDAAPAAEGNSSETGAIFHYGLSATSNDLGALGRNWSSGGDFTLNVFTPSAVFQNGGFLVGGPGGWQAARLETSMVLDDPEKLRHLTLGDAITATPDWARATRFAGLEYASDFSLRPGLVTQPLPSFFGQSAVPATIDVYSGAVRTYQQTVSPGPFSLRNLPVVTGGGTATIVTTDVLGRQTAQQISLFTDQGMLAPGLTDYAFDAGFRRTDYGRSSFRYDDPLVSANWRHGVSETLTLQAHSEVAQHIAMAGAGGELGFGFGSLSANFAGSESRNGRGDMVSVGLQFNSGPVHFFGNGMLASPTFRDVASLDHDTAPPRLRYQLGANMDMREWGILAFSWLDNKNANSGSRQYMTSSWSVTLPNDMFFSLSGLRDFRDHAFSAEFSLNMALGGNAMGGVSGNVNSDRVTSQAVYNSPSNPDGGIGYRVTVGSENGGRFLGNASYIGSDIAADGGIAVQDRRVGLQANTDGAIIVLRGSLFTAHNPGEAIALVDTGEKNVRVYLENREIARSNDKGQVLLTGLNPYAANHVGVDPRDYAFETIVDKTDTIVTPRRHGGSLVNLAPARRHAVAVQVVQGGALPVGAQVFLDGDVTPIVVGHDGRFLVADLKSSRGATVRMGGQECRIYIQYNASSSGLATNVCLREASGAY